MTAKNAWSWDNIPMVEIDPPTRGTTPQISENPRDPRPGLLKPPEELFRSKRPKYEASSNGAQTRV